MITIPEQQPILLVDDDEADRAILKVVLKKSKLRNETIFHADGQAALDYLETSIDGQNPTPGLALLDINMPGLTGFDVLSQIRSQNEFEELPVVVMLTSSEAKQDSERATKLGATTSLAKQSGLIDFVNLFNHHFTNEPSI